MSAAAIFGELVAGWLLADFLGGALHWFEDRMMRLSWPFLGRWVVEPNRLHHAEPLAFTHGSLLSRNGTAWVSVVAIGALWEAIAGLSLTWAAAVIGGLMTAQVHYWSHSKHRPRWVEVLQQTGLFQSRPHHWVHHGAGVDRYCVLTDLLNPMLDGIAFWSGIERALAIVGIRPDPVHAS